MILYEELDLDRVAIIRDEDTNELYIQLSELIFAKAEPKLVMTMKGALYCRKYGLDPITVPMADFSDTNEKYRTLRNTDIPLYQEELTTSCKAVETEKGVLLFSDDNRGISQFDEYLQYLADNFYEPDFGINTLRIYDLNLPSDKLPEEINRCFNYERPE